MTWYPRRYLSMVLFLGLCLGLGSCTDSRSETQAPTPPPAAFNRAAFPDIPFPRGFVLSQEHDQVAAGYAGGLVRAMDMTLIATTDKQETPAESLVSYNQLLQRAGWNLNSSPGSTPLMYSKPISTPSNNKQLPQQNEQLLLTTGRAEKLTIIRIRIQNQQH